MASKVRYRVSAHRSNDTLRVHTYRNLGPALNTRRAMTVAHMSNIQLHYLCDAHGWMEMTSSGCPRCGARKDH
jgi:hypothetical protein